MASKSDDRFENLIKISVENDIVNKKELESLLNVLDQAQIGNLFFNMFLFNCYSIK